MLHIVNKSPYERNNLTSCLRLAKAGSVILLIEDAIYAAIASGQFHTVMTEAAEKYQIHVLRPDLNARGFDDTAVIPNVTLIDYHGFVELTEQETNIQSWL